MKKLFFTISAIAFLGLSGCYKATCTDPFAPNYTLEGSCIDLTTNITGTYTGTFSDSIVGLHNSTSPITIHITRVNDGQVQIDSASNAAFVGYTANLSASSIGYLTVPAQTAGNGLMVTGAGTYFGNPSDGVYTSAGRQLTIYVLAGTQYQGFTGTH
jgi:hypothetical protein